MIRQPGHTYADVKELAKICPDGIFCRDADDIEEVLEAIDRLDLLTTTTALIVRFQEVWYTDDPNPLGSGGAGVFERLV